MLKVNTLPTDDTTNFSCAVRSHRIFKVVEYFPKMEKLIISGFSFCEINRILEWQLGEVAIYFRSIAKDGYKKAIKYKPPYKAIERYNKNRRKVYELELNAPVWAQLIVMDPHQDLEKLLDYLKSQFSSINNAQWNQVRATMMKMVVHTCLWNGNRVCSVLSVV